MYDVWTRKTLSAGLLEPSQYGVTFWGVYCLKNMENYIMVDEGTWSCL